MSGEYFCIEEVDPASYYEDYEAKRTVLPPENLTAGTCTNDRQSHDRHNLGSAKNPNFDRNVSKSRDGRSHEKHTSSSSTRDKSAGRGEDHDAISVSSKKSQDLILYEIEEQLKVAENRCNALKGHIHCMKKIYESSGKNEEASHPKRSQGNREQKKAVGDDIFKRKISRKGAKSSQVAYKNRTYSPDVGHHEPLQDSSDTIPHKSSSSSTNLAPHHNYSQFVRKEAFTAPLIRQNSPSIGTDHSGAATKTMNNILTGITNSVNKVTQVQCQPKETIKLKKHATDVTDHLTETIRPAFEMPCHISPRLEKRIIEQQRKVTEMQKAKKLPVVLNSMEAAWNNGKISATSIKSKAPKSVWSRHTQKTATKKTKIQHSSGSVNIPKPIKSTAKPVENTTKMRPVRTAMVEDTSPSLIIAKKRKRPLKRLRPTSSKYETRNLDEEPPFEQSPSNNLIELYHNVAAKTSDSDESNNFSGKAQAARQKGGGDLPIISTQIEPHFEPKPEKSLPVTSNKVTKIFNPNRVLTPINEHVYMKRAHTTTDCMSTLTKNYELPTIASKLKQVAKNYLTSFNFRKIPFCVAKSTTPSHNIGVNIQQVMSIMKTKQPVNGLSPTLAHNIGLAAGKFQNSPLSALVSTLSTKMAYRQSHCPLSLKTNLNYTQLQEMAKTIEEEPYEERPGFAGDGGNEKIEPATDVPEEPQPPPQWTLDPAQVDQCTCPAQVQKNVPFQHVLNKYHVSSECIPKPPQPQKFGGSQIIKIPLNKNHVARANIAQLRQCKTAYGTAVQKNRTKNWVNTTASVTVTPTVLAEEPKVETCEGALQGKERNLKTVLTNLYEEFDSLNTKYEALSKHINKSNAEASDLTMKELEDMEKMLNKKEEEINMVMSLYTEVLALKDQVKKLREKASHSGISVNNNSQQMKGSEFKEPATAAHLTQLLRQIQNYQTHCKNKKIK